MPLARPVLAVVLALLALAPAAVRAQSPAAVGRLAGVVYDSLTRRPLAGAAVFGPGARVTTADAAGRWALDSVPAGPGAVTFSHPALDSLGLGDASDLGDTVTVRPGAEARVALATPSRATLVARLCGRAAPNDSAAAVVFGTVADARGTFFEGARVAVTWRELVDPRRALAAGAAGGASPVRERTAATDARGAYAACGVPAGELVSVQAVTDRGRTGVVDVIVPEAGVLRFDLVVGERPVAAAPAGAGAASAVPNVRPAAGPAALAGEVTGEDGRPLAGVRVTPTADDDASAPPDTARTDAEGRFRLAGLPEGTQSVDLTAVGYIPARRVVRLRAGAPAELRVSLRRVTRLPGVTVTAEAAAAASKRFFAELERRKAMSRGFIRTADELKNYPQLVSVFQEVPRAIVQQVGAVYAVRFRNPLNPLATCEPQVYVDGQLGGALGGSDLLWDLAPRDLAAVEVYNNPANAPATIVVGDNFCGIVMVWTKHHARMPGRP